MNDAGKEIERLLEMMARLPGLGPRSARRVVLHLVKKKETVLVPLCRALTEVTETVRSCVQCGNIGTKELCSICADPKRDGRSLCIVEDVSDLWAMERAAVFKGHYFVLGGVLSALDGVGPADLGLDRLFAQAEQEAPAEVILALNATVDGQTTAHYIAERLTQLGVPVSSLAQGIPVGGELDYLDDGTIIAALQARKSLG